MWNWSRFNHCSIIQQQRSSDITIMNHVLLWNNMQKLSLKGKQSTPSTDNSKEVWYYCLYQKDEIEISQLVKNNDAPKRGCNEFSVRMLKYIPSSNEYTHIKNKRIQNKFTWFWKFFHLRFTSSDTFWKQFHYPNWIFALNINRVKLHSYFCYCCLFKKKKINFTKLVLVETCFGMSKLEGPLQLHI